MPAAQPASYSPNSLWRSGSRAFFKDQRAHQVGDILTVTVNITDKANIANDTKRSRANAEEADVGVPARHAVGEDLLFGRAQRDEAKTRARSRDPVHRRVGRGRPRIESQRRRFYEGDPHAMVHDQMFERDIALYARRHNMRPGISGWAQVNGYRGETSTADKMRGRIEHDLQYIDRWSISLDLKIMFLTVFSGRAYRNAC